jgi:type II secretory pathway component HofQ
MEQKNKSFGTFYQPKNGQSNQYIIDKYTNIYINTDKPHTIEEMIKKNSKESIQVLSIQSGSLFK